MYRTFRGIGPETLAGLWEAMAQVRAGVWRRSATTIGSAPVVLDLDASLVEIHSENKQGTAATCRGGFGYPPLFCFADATGETLAALLRPGNATANSVADTWPPLTRRWASCLQRSPPATGRATTPPRYDGRWWWAATRPGLARVSVPLCKCVASVGLPSLGVHEDHDDGKRQD